MNDVFQINKALHLGLRAVGKGRAAALTLSGVLNMPEPVQNNVWTQYTEEASKYMITIKS